MLLVVPDPHLFFLWPFIPHKILAAIFSSFLEFMGLFLHKDFFLFLTKFQLYPNAIQGQNIYVISPDFKNKAVAVL